MVHDKKAFAQDVAYYRKALAGTLGKGKICLVELKLSNEKAFFSLAPLSRVVHELGADMSVFVAQKESTMLGVLGKAWGLYARLKQGEKSTETKALEEFIKSVEKKAKGREFSRLFKKPDLYIIGGANGFTAGENKLCAANFPRLFSAEKRLEFRIGWFRKRLWKELLATASKILKQGYGVKKSERFSVGFDLIPTAKELELPLDDYLGSLSIIYTFALKAASLCKSVSMGAGTSRKSQLEPMERISDLAATILGCEYEKNINEPWFRAFRKLSPIIGADKLKYAAASFGIHGQGYGGKHFFGLKIGYPTPNRKSRWQSPGTMLLKPYWLEQTKHDSRPAMRRHAITDTLPLTNYVRTCNIDYFALRKRDVQIRNVLKKCSRLFAVGIRTSKGQTNLSLDTRHLFSGKGPILTSDIEVNPITPPEAAKIFKTKSGRYGNFPGGEVFFTPHRVDGTFIGDVVTSIDKSYVIPKKQPMVLSVRNGQYKLLKASPLIRRALEKRKKESWKMLGIFEKNKSMPAKMVKSMRRNFNNLGEFAVNTNPKARLSRYLIETEKLANMMHIALGSGYEPGRETMYHCDIVINAPKQKMDLWGSDPKGRQHWIIRKGKFVV